MARAMALAMKVVCNEEGRGSEGDGDKGGRQAMARRAMAMAMATSSR